MIKYIILSPVKSYKEVQLLLEEDVVEFYGGLVSDSNQLNDRPNNSEYNFNSLNELSKSIDLIHANNGKFFFTLNRLSLNLNDIEKTIDDINKLNIDALIVASLSLINILKDQIDIPIHLSTVEPIISSYSIEYIYNRIGNIDRVCLERGLSFGSIKELIKTDHIFELELFVFSGFCRFIEGYCNMHHLEGAGNKGCLFHFMKSDKKLYNLSSIGEACAFCSLYDIYNDLSGINKNIYLKIEGRNKDIAYKLKIVKGVKKAIDIIYNSTGKNRLKKVYKTITGVKCNFNNCYYINGNKKKYL